MKWSDVRPGQKVRVKGEVWEVTAREGDAITLVHPTLGEKTGSPPPDGDVMAVYAATGEANPAASKPSVSLQQAHDTLHRHRDDNPKERDRLVQYAKEQGISFAKVRERTVEELRDLISAHHDKLVAEENDVPAREVMDAHVRLILGATRIADLHEHSQLPQCPTVEAMESDMQTFRNHMHFFHQFQPSGTDMERLKRLHQQEHDETREEVLHDHTVPF